MRKITVDGSQLDNLDIKSLAKQFKADFNPQASGSVVSGGMKAVGTPLYKDLYNLADNRAEISIIAPKKYPILNSQKKYWTIALGGTAGVAAIGGFYYGLGAYGSNTGEIGLYNGYGCQMQTNVGYNFGGEVNYIFGPPSTFSGLAFALGVDFQIPWGVLAGLGVSGRFLFNTNFNWIGWSLGFSGGWSALPLNFTVQVGDTNLKPLANLW
jgi:hypothetical protein